MKKEARNELIATALFVVVVLALVMLFGCKAPQKAMSETKWEEKKDIANDISKSEKTQLYEAISRGVQTAISEKLQLSINQKIYDTDKPVDPGTGRPPLKEENNIDLKKESDTQINDSTHAVKTAKGNSLLVDKTKDKSKGKNEDLTKTETQMSRIEVLAICIVVALLVGLAIYILRKYRYGNKRN